MPLRPCVLVLMASLCFVPCLMWYVHVLWKNCMPIHNKNKTSCIQLQKAFDLVEYKKDNENENENNKQFETKCQFPLSAYTTLTLCNGGRGKRMKNGKTTACTKLKKKKNIERVVGRRFSFFFFHWHIVWIDNENLVFFFLKWIINPMR